MIRRALFGAIAGLILVGILGWGIARWFNLGLETEEKAEYHLPPPAGEVLVDDRLEDKTPAFDPSVVDRRSLREWRVNLSAAVIKLDMEGIRPDGEDDLRALYPSYKAAAEVARKRFRRQLLPSVNVL